MKSLYTILLLSVLILWPRIGYSQKILVADNRADAPEGDHIYSTLQDAIDNATQGDIIHVIPSSKNYGDVNIAKQLEIVGIGFNPGKEFFQTSSVIGKIVLKAGVSQLKLSGLIINQITYEGYFEIDGLLLDKCQVTYFGNAGNSTTPINVIMTNCIFRFRVYLTSNSGLYSKAEIRNSIFYANAGLTGIIYAKKSTIKNCNFISSYNRYNSTAAFAERSGSRYISTLTNSIVENCLFYYVEFGTGGRYPGTAENATIFNNNQVYMNRVKSDSLAKNAGTDGTDLGIYGGDTPFVNSGVSVPIIQELTVPLKVPTGEDIEVKVKVRSY